MKTIVSPTNFSAISLHAVNYAADLACNIHADLHLIHVCPTAITMSEVPIPGYDIAELFDDAIEQMKALKENLAARTNRSIIINTEVKQGIVVPVIEDYCAVVKPYAVVMGTESAGAFERFLLGAKTLSAMKHLSWPLIIVPPNAIFQSILKIGLACDFRNVMQTVPAKQIRELVNGFHAGFHVLHVSPETDGDISLETAEESQWLHDALGELHPVYHFIRGTAVEMEINEFAEKNEIDLLLVIPKKHSLVSSVFQHSHSKRLVLHAHVPVMAIHEN